MGYRNGGKPEANKKATADLAKEVLKFEVNNEDIGQIGEIRMKERLIDNVKFNIVIGFFIVLNILLIGIENDLSEAPSSDCPSIAERIRARLVWYLFENIFLVVFLLELIIRMWTLRWAFFRSVFNIMDAGLVVMGVVDTWILTFLASCGGGHLRVLLVLRVVRMLRLVRFVKLLRSFKELWMIVTGLVNSIKTLIWISVLLICLMYVSAIFLTSQIGQNRKFYDGLSYDGSVWPAEIYFGSVPKTMLTLWQISTLDGWADSIVRHVVYKQPLLFLFFMFYILLTTFGIFNIIVGVIVENTLGIATSHEEQTNKSKDLQKRKAVDSLRRVFEMSDSDRSGAVSREEFRAACKLKEVQEKFEFLGIEAQEAEDLFTLMDPTGRGEIKLNDFVSSCMQMIGGAQQRDIMQVSLVVEGLARKVEIMGTKVDICEQAVKDMADLTEAFVSETLVQLTAFMQRYAFADRKYRAEMRVPGVSIVGTAEAAKRAREELEKLTQPVAWHVAVTDLDRSRYTAFDRGRLISLTGVAGAKAWFVDCWKDAGEDTLKELKPYFAAADKAKVFHDFDEASHVLARHELPLEGLLTSTRSLSRLVDSSLGSWEGKETQAKMQKEDEGVEIGYDLKDLAGYYGLTNGAASSSGLPSDGGAAHCDQRYFETWVKENVYMARLSERLYAFLRQRLEDTPWSSEVLTEPGLNLWDYAQEIFLPLTEMLVDIERRGFLIDEKFIQKLKMESTTKLEFHLSAFTQLLAEMKDPKTGRPVNPGAEFINPRSTAMMRQLLFGGSSKKFPPKEPFVTHIQSWINIQGLGLQPLGDKKTKFFTKAGQAKVSSEVLIAFAGKNPENGEFGAALDQLLPTRGEQLAKNVCLMLHHAEKVNKTSAMLTGMIDPIYERLCPDDGKLHASLSLDTSTGRLVSRKPNLQNPPGNDFRHAFTAGPGNTLIVADYSQLELRILAHVSKCASMIANLCSGADYHSATAVEMFPEIAAEIANKSITINEVKHKYSTQRAQAKVINFSIVYGKSVRSLAEDLKITEKAAAELLEAWYASKPEVRRWKAEIVQQVHGNNFSYSLLGRPRYFPHIESVRLKNRSERAAINHCIQGSAADLAIAAMLRVRISEKLRNLGFAMVLQVHDEFILEGPEAHAPEALEIVKDLMEHPFADINPEFEFRVPMLVEAGVGKTWADAKP